MKSCGPLTLLLVYGAIASPASAQEKPVVGLIPRAQKPIAMDGKLNGWDGAFVTPVHVGHPDFANRGGQFLYLWDEQNLYIGLRCLDQKPAHIGTDNQIWNGDAVEFYLDTRQGDQLGAAAFGPGTLHMFYTPFTKTDVKPRLQVRDLPAFKDFKLHGAEVAAVKTAWATPPSSSSRGSTSRVSHRSPARSSASSASCAAATAGRGWIGPSSTPRRPPSAVRPLSAGCNWWTGSTPLP
jgi:hypothetical protein